MQLTDLDLLHDFRRCALHSAAIEFQIYPAGRAFLDRLPGLPHLHHPVRLIRRDRGDLDVDGMGGRNSADERAKRQHH